MINLGSNSILTELPWLGSDTVITYPSVITCITVTCVCGSTLVGCHLFYGNSNEKTLEDMQAFGAKAKGASKMYLVGMLDSWGSGVRNRTGLRFADGSLVQALRESCAYTGTILVYNTSSESEVEIRADYVSASTAQIAYTPGSSSSAVTLRTSDFTLGASNVIKTSSGDSCNIM